MANKGFYEPSLTPLSEPRRPYEEVFKKMERYEAALKEIANTFEIDWHEAQEIAREALDDVVG